MTPADLETLLREAELIARDYRDEARKLRYERDPDADLCDRVANSQEQLVAAIRELQAQHTRDTARRDALLEAADRPLAYSRSVDTGGTYVHAVAGLRAKAGEVKP